ncbi:hypothetical protein K474DRAFT_180054 [Panus rudis PR-1116 ss-1]|nr:hypothetical protein K474DRAFT_180054 [Panus rudis PR-1116 ss-1]
MVSGTIARVASLILMIHHFTDLSLMGSIRSTYGVSHDMLADVYVSTGCHTSDFCHSSRISREGNKVRSPYLRHRRHFHSQTVTEEIVVLCTSLAWVTSCDQMHLIIIGLLWICLPCGLKTS